MAVQTFSTAFSAEQTNWLVARRFAAQFAPHATDIPSLAVVIDAGHLLNGTNLIERPPQIVDSISPPATAVRVDRIVIDRATGEAALVTGIDGSMMAPPLPAGSLPCARVYLDPTTSAITNDSIVDERCFSDLSLSYTSPVLCRATLNGVDQTGIPNDTWTLIRFSATDFNIGNAFDTATHQFRPSLPGHYLVSVKIFMSAHQPDSGQGAAIFRNGTVYSSLYSATANSFRPDGVTVTDIVFLDGVTDQVTARVRTINNTEPLAGHPAATVFTASRL